MFKDEINHLSDFFGKDIYQVELNDASGEFSSKIGKVFEDEPLYETWSTTFYHWYLFDRAIEGLAVSPVYLYGRLFEDQLDENQKHMHKAFMNSCLSLFQIESLGSVVVAKDLIKDTRVSISHYETPSFLQKGHLVILRVFSNGQTWEKMEEEWYLPDNATSAISKQVHMTKNKKNFVFELIRRKLFAEKFSHVAMEEIFNWSPGSELEKKFRLSESL
ncbi:MAG: hypothetical protein KDD52_08300 [Bdellovibrionales bacterium]|nr:hypothetical protein [Bdellovibrionales bacterium]